MERHLGSHRMHTPASHDAVTSGLPIPSVELDVEVDAPAATDRLVAQREAISRDRGLERLSPDRIAELRMRLETGAYASPEVMTALAMRLLESGDL